MKTTAIILVGLICLLVAGCSPDIEVEGMNYGGVNEVCIRGVVYYDHIKKMAPAYNVDGTLILCN